MCIVKSRYLLDQEDKRILVSALRERKCQLLQSSARCMRIIRASGSSPIRSNGRKHNI